jgi:hypothetical protein
VDGGTLYGQMATFADDVNAALAALGADPPGRVLVQPYGTVIDDGCLHDDCGGQLAIVLDQLFRAAAFPAPDVLPVPCVCDGEAVAVLRARISRCVSGLDDNGNPPTPEVASAEAAVALVDATALYEAACTFAARFDYALTGTVLPAGPEGRCGAYEVTVTVSPDDYTPPPEEP